jgi:hypothetical protein
MGIVLLLKETMFHNYLATVVRIMQSWDVAQLPPDAFSVRCNKGNSMIRSLLS